MPFSAFTYVTYNPDSRDNNLCDKRILAITNLETGVDKTRNTEHSGTSRNIPEHPGTRKNKSNCHEKKIN